MAFILNSVIKIGAYTFYGGVNNLVIKKSIHAVVDTATLKIPAMGRVVSKSNTANLPQSSVETAKLFKEGDKVSIDLGYNDDLRDEFRGFVRRVNIATPVTIDLEGYAWQLRNKPAITQSWKKVTVRQLLERVIEGTDIVLSDAIPDITLTDYHLRSADRLKVLDYLKDKMLLTVFFDDNVLYAGIQEAVIKGTVKHSIGFNTIKDDNLKQRLASDTRVRVRLKTKGKNGKHTLYEAGDPDGAVTEINMPFSKDAAYLQNMAAAKLKQLKYNGYEGKVTGFLQPYAKPCFKDVLIDKQYEGARAGTYFVPSTEVRFGLQGGRRITEISYRLDG